MSCTICFRCTLQMTLELCFFNCFHLHVTWEFVFSWVCPTTTMTPAGTIYIYTLYSTSGCKCKLAGIPFSHGPQRHVRNVPAPLKTAKPPPRSTCRCHQTVPAKTFCRAYGSRASNMASKAVKKPAALFQTAQLVGEEGQGPRS